MEVTSPFESVKEEILQKLSGTSEKRIVRLILKQYCVSLIEKEDVPEGIKYTINYTLGKHSKEAHTWEFIHKKQN